MRTLRLPFAAAWLGSLVSGCSFPYYWQAVEGQFGLLRQRSPIAALLENGDLAPQTRESLQLVLEVREFATGELGLPDNGSYRTYVELGRPYVVWNVVATEEFSIDPMSWCFPFAGCVSYRGYFDEAAARRFASRLEAEGFDIALGGATAYSTLGYFADPVLSTMLSGPAQSIAALLIHELAHQRFYVKDDSELNEAFATAVEEYGTERWLRRAGDADGEERYRARMRRRTQFSGLVGAQQTRLQEIFAGTASPEAKRRAKQAAFDRMRAEYEALKREWDGSADYDPWFSRSLNNAHLASVATYRRWLPGLRWILEARGLEGFYGEMESLRALSREERRGRLQEWLDGALSARNARDTVTAPFAGEIASPGRAAPFSGSGE